MKKLLPFLIGLLSIASLSAKTKIATVDTARIFSECTEIVAEEEKLQEELKKMSEDPRVKAIQEEQAKIIAQQEGLVTSSAPEEERQKLATELQGRIRELQALQKDAAEELGSKRKELQQHILDVSKENFKKIRLIIDGYAKKKGYTMVLETSAQTNTRLPAVLYLKDASDITDDIIKLVNE